VAKHPGCSEAQCRNLKQKTTTTPTWKKRTRLDQFGKTEKKKKENRQQVNFAALALAMTVGSGDGSPFPALAITSFGNRRGFGTGREACSCVDEITAAGIGASSRICLAPTVVG
jgi:hypothetical protein